MKPSEYDGFYFLPLEDDEDGINFVFFELKGENAGGEKIGGNAIGDEWHIAFFRKDENDEPAFDETFDAILGDPLAYVKTLVGANLYGCILRKTTKSGKWFDDYLKRALGHITIKKLKNYAQAIADAPVTKE